MATNKPLIFKFPFKKIIPHILVQTEISAHKISFSELHHLKILISLMVSLGSSPSVTLNLYTPLNFLQCVVLWAFLAEWCPTLYLPMTQTHP